ncbi:MAG TPA: GyrI-like domain-containing protein, partial [Chitinophagales bacterium]|nr:GyrI-like domain-containing protein [Chitinophagales bacterium]
FVIKTTPAITLVGKRITTSLVQNRTAELWRSFMPHRKSITYTVGTSLYSAQLYADGYFNSYNPAAEFEKWAAVEVTGFENLPEGMEVLTIPAGMYAVFIHKGPAADGPKTFQYIFTQWLPQSGYVVDNRPHFEVMGEKYKADSPDSEEELWVPVKAR